MTPMFADVLVLLADEAPRNPGPDFGKASPFGLAVIVLLLIGTFVLVWSMNRHLRKLPKTFDDGEDSGDSGTVGADPDLTTESPTEREPD